MATPRLQVVLRMRTEDPKTGSLIVQESLILLLPQCDWLRQCVFSFYINVIFFFSPFVTVLCLNLSMFDLCGFRKCLSAPRPTSLRFGGTMVVDWLGVSSTKEVASSGAATTPVLTRMASFLEVEQRTQSWDQRGGTDYRVPSPGLLHFLVLSPL